METILLSQHVTAMAQPFVADVLYRLSQHFTCRLMWQRQSDTWFGPMSLQAEGMPETPRGVVPRTGPPIGIGTSADVTLGEYTWRLRDEWPIWQGRARGIVKLRANVEVTFCVPEGLPQELGSPGHSSKGFLCEAVEWQITGKNGTTHTYYELDTSVGTIWLRTPPTSRLPQLGYIVAERSNPPVRRGRCVVHIAEWENSRLIGDPYTQNTSPWEGLSTRDETGRRWVIEGSSLHFSAAFQLEAGPSRHELEQRSRIELYPPYETVWRPTGSGVLVPLEHY